MKESGEMRFKQTMYESTRAPQKSKPTPPRCARQPLPKEGARAVTPSFLWKEVPRRGGGWLGIAVFSKQSLPLEGKVPRRGGSGTGGMKESGEMRFKQAIYGSTQAPIFVNGDAQKRYSSRKSLAVSNPQPLIPTFKPQRGSILRLWRAPSPRGCAF